MSVYEHTRRGSLAETQYFVHLARRLNYLSSEGADASAKQTKLNVCLPADLIVAVEKEAGKFSKFIARATSLMGIGLMRWSGSQLSVVS